MSERRECRHNAYMTMQMVCDDGVTIVVDADELDDILFERGKRIVKKAKK